LRSLRDYFLLADAADFFERMSLRFLSVSFLCALCVFYSLRSLRDRFCPQIAQIFKEDFVAFSLRELPLRSLRDRFCPQMPQIFLKGFLCAFFARYFLIPIF
jgi:hypothetical protein